MPPMPEMPDFLKKSETDKAIESKKNIQKAKEEEARRIMRSKGRNSTILSGPMGAAQNNVFTGKKTLLGE